MPPRTAKPVLGLALRGSLCRSTPFVCASATFLPRLRPQIQSQVQSQAQLRQQPHLQICPLSTTTTTTTTTTTASAAPSQRTLFIHVSPPPQTLAQRRAVLRIVERHGPTDLFKKTAANDSFLCIAATAAMATALVKKSPFSYNVADTLVSSAPSAPSAPKTYTLSVFPAAAYPHRTAIRSGPLYGPWPADVEPALATSPSFKNTFVYNALRGVVPEGAAADALCDWRPRPSFVSSRSGAENHGDSDKEARIRGRRGRRSHAQRSVLSGLVGR